MGIMEKRMQIIIYGLRFRVQDLGAQGLGVRGFRLVLEACLAMGLWVLRTLSPKP